MHAALVMDPDVLGRNVLRCALERLGYVVQAVPGVLEADQALAARPFDLVALAGTGSSEAALNVARRLRGKGWRGRLVYVASVASDDQLRELTRDLAACAVFHKPLGLDEVQLRLSRVVPPELDPKLVEEAHVPASWNGALRRARKDYGKNLLVWVQSLVHELSEGRRTGDRGRLSEADRLAAQIAADAAKFLFPGVAEASAAIHDLLREILDGRVPGGAQAAVWNDIDDLLEVLSLSAPSAERSLATVDSAQIESFDRTVLVVWPDVDGLIDLAKVAAEHGVGLLTARNLKEALRLAVRRSFDGALVAADLPDGGVALLIEWLQRQPGLADLPVALLVPPGEGADPDRVAAARSRGARFVVEAPLAERRFLAAVERLTKARPARRARLLLLDPDRTTAGQLKGIAEGNRMELLWSSSAAQIGALLDTQRPDLVAIDVMLPVGGGLDVVRQIRASARWGSVPVVLLAGQPTPKVRLAGLRAGADDVIAKPLDAEEVGPRLVALHERFRLLREVDPVTGALGRGPFVARLAELLEGDDEVAFGLVDPEGFRHVVRAGGQAFGDRALGALAVALHDVVTDRGIVGRWGNDVLAVAVAGETRTGLQTLFQVLAQKLKLLRLDAPSGARVTLAARTAATSTSRVGRNLEALVAEVEQGLRTGKGLAP